MESLASPTASTTSPSASAPPEYTRFRACDECRRRKIKCDGRVSGCRHCLNAAVQCVYNNPKRTARKRAASSQKSQSDPESAVNLEERLERIERAVREHLTSRLSAVPQDAKDLGISTEEDLAEGDASEKEVRPTNPNPSKSKERALYLWKVANEDSIGHDGGLIADFQGKLKFIGESSVFSLFLPRGMQWICEKIGEPNPPDPLKPGSIMEWNRNPPQDVSGEYHTCTTFFEGAEAPLPARHIVRKYINDYFDKINYELPIFNRDRFEAELGMFYQNGSRASPAWLLAFYVILALGCISNPAEEPAATRAANEAQALAFFRTGCRSIPTVLFCNRDICGIQALLAAVLYLWETKSTEGCFTLLGVAASIGSEIGLHRCGTQLGLGPKEVELRQNLFWVAYILDKDMSLRIGRPSSMVDDDVTVKLPSAHGGSCSSRLFYHRVKLAKILSKVSRLLCSHVNTTLPDDALLGTIKMLDVQLEEWRSGCEVMHSDEETLGSGEQIEALHNIRLRLVYFSCLGAIKRPLNPAFDRQEDGGLARHGLSEGFETCLFAARSSIRLIDFLEKRNIKMLRSIAIYLVAAAVTLFANILDDPLSDSVIEDLPYLKRVCEYLRAELEKGCLSISEMFFLTYTLYSMASQTVARFQMGIFGAGAIIDGGNGDVAVSDIYQHLCFRR